MREETRKYYGKNKYWVLTIQDSSLYSFETGYETLCLAISDAKAKTLLDKIERMVVIGCGKIEWNQEPVLYTSYFE